jgi:hypothetical protein
MAQKGTRTMLPCDIQNIRYATYEGDGPSKIEFDVFGIWYRIREPMDVLLVDGGDAARKWIHRRYSILILDKTAAKRAFANSPPINLP